MCSDKKNMANTFNEYFAIICTNNNPCNNTVPHTEYLKAFIHSTFKLKTINNATTLQYLSNLKPSNSCGHDNISSAILKSISAIKTQFINRFRIRIILFRTYQM